MANSISAPVDILSMIGRLAGWH